MIPRFLVCLVIDSPRKPTYWGLSADLADIQPACGFVVNPENEAYYIRNGVAVVPVGQLELLVGNE